MHRSSRRQAKSPIVQSTRHRRIINCESLSNSSLLASWLLVSCRRLGMSAKCPWNVRVYMYDRTGLTGLISDTFQLVPGVPAIPSNQLSEPASGELHRLRFTYVTNGASQMFCLLTYWPQTVYRPNRYLSSLSCRQKPIVAAAIIWPVWADVGKDHVVLVHIMKGVKNLSEWSHDLLLRLLRQRRMPVDATTTDKLLQYTGSQRPHRCCPLANQVEIENIDCGEVCLVWPPKPPPLVGEIRVPANTQLLAFQSPHGSAFWSWLTDRYTDRPRYNGNNRPHLMLRIATPMGRNNNVNSINNNYSDNSSNEVMQKIIHFE